MMPRPSMAPTRGERVLAFLGVEPSEGRAVALMAAHSFAMGWATVLFKTAASATFLARFPGSYLPWVYIAAAGVNTVTGTVYANVQRRVSFARLMKGTLWFLLAMVLSVRTGFAVSNVAWVAFAGLVSYRVLASLTDLEYWAIASRIYDVRQAKRLFGLIGTGEVVARIVGSFSVPLLVAIGGVSNLMLLSAAALVLCLVLVGAVLRPVDELHADVPPTREARAGVVDIVRNRYLAVVVGVAVLATFGKYFIDFAFLQEMSRVHDGEAQIATFIGVFSGVAQTLSLLTRVFISRPLLHRFGIRIGVMVLPIAHALCAAVTVICGLLGASPAIVFWLVIINQGIYDTLKHPIDNASFKVLYQPLKAAQRLATQIAVEVVFSPVVVGIAGAVMLTFSAGMTYDPVVFSGVLFGNFVLWALLARAAGHGYQRKLVDNLRRPIEGNVALSFDDATTMAVVRARLDSASAGAVCVALHMLEKANPDDLIETLVANTAHASPDVRRYALERLAERQPSALRGLRTTISRDPNATVRRAGARAIAATSGIRAIQEMTPYLQDPDPIVRGAAVTALFDLKHDGNALRAAIDAVSELARSSRRDNRALGARLAGEHGLASLVRTLLGDESVVVRRAAVRAAGAIGGPEFTKMVVPRLLDPQLAHAAALGLASQGEAVIPLLDANFHGGTDRLMFRRLVGVHRMIGGPAAIAALRGHLESPDAMVRGHVLAALDAIGYVAHASDRAAIIAMMAAEAREAAWTLGVLRDLDDAPELADLRAALGKEVSAAAQRVFDLLAFVHDRVTVHRIAANIANGAKDKRAYAHEVLDLLLVPAERGLLAPLLDDAPSAERFRRLSGIFPQPELATNAQLGALIARSERWLRSFPRALAIQAASRRGITEGVAAWVASSDPFIRETAIWATQPTAKERSMLLIEKVIMLKTVPMFAETEDELLGEIAALFEELESRAGEMIFAKGDEGESMYVVVSGRVDVFDGDTHLSVLGETEIFGELALLDPQPRSASVKALEDTRLFRLDGETFSQLMAGNVEIVHGVLRVLCERLRRTSATAGSV